MRNATVTTIAPTGTIGVIAGCSQGCEPLYAISYVRNVQETIGSDLVYVNPAFEAQAIMAGIYDEELMKKISRKSSIQTIEQIPEEIKKIFVTAHDISPEWHVRMQAAFQRYTDNAVSKTINFPNYATPQDIEKAYWLAYELGCKGLTVYRDGSRKYQILTTNSSKDSVSRLVSKTGGCDTCEI
jgi:ribonucleoside-diphosphate reductase alpha chain